MKLFIKRITHENGKVIIEFNDGNYCILTRSEINVISTLLMEMFTDRRCGVQWKPKKDDND